MVFELSSALVEDVGAIIELLHAESKNLFFDVQIDCRSIILSSHKYVLSSRSNVLAEQLSTLDENRLNWTDYEANTCIALLRWIYTDKVDLDSVPFTLDLLRASHHLQLVPLFETCESSLLLSVTESTAHQIYDIAKETGAKRLMEKCLTEHRSNFSSYSTEKLQPETVEDTLIDFDFDAMANNNGMEFVKLTKDIFEKLETSLRIATGCLHYKTFADINISYNGDIWHGHAYVVGSRSEKIRNEIAKSPKDHPLFYFRGLHRGIESMFLRWLYTDYVKLTDVSKTLKMLEAAHHYQLPTLFDRCEEALVKAVDITLCAQIHKIATEVDTITLLERCKQLISSYWIGLQSHDMADAMDVDLEKDSDNSLCEIADCELTAQETTTEFLTLNDDCLLHLFRYLKLVDLGSMKDTCKRLNKLADRSFKIYRDKSIRITESTMFADIWNLKHFGKLIRMVDFRGFYDIFTSYDDIFEMIARFTGDELKSISLNFNSDENVTAEMLKHLEKVLKRVEIVKLRWLEKGEYIDLLLGYCENLKEVHVEGDVTSTNTIWCSNNSNMKSVTWIGISSDEILEELCEKLPNLESLYVDEILDTTERIINFSQLKHLKRLRIDAEIINIGGALQKFTSENVLEYFHLMYANIDEILVRALDYLPHLKELIFEYCRNFDQYCQMVLSTTLVNVEKLSFIRCETITFEEITTIVKNLFNLKQLSIFECELIDGVDKQNYLRLRRKRNLEIFLGDTDYARSIESIGEDLSKYVRITAKR